MKDGRDVLELLLRERSPEERERLAEAWERAAGGDPDSLPAIYALADRFSLEAHAALLAEIRTIHGHLEGMAREIGQGARATVERTEAAARGVAGKTSEFSGLLGRFENLARERVAAEAAALATMTEAGTRMASELDQAKAGFKESQKWRLVAGMAIAAGVVFAALGAAGFLTGAELRTRHERRELDALLSRWETGEGEAYKQLLRRIEEYRALPKEAGEPLK